MSITQIKTQTNLIYCAFVDYIRCLGFEIDPGCKEILQQTIENEVIKEMIARGEDSDHFLSITQCSAGN